MSNQKFTWCNDLDGNSQTSSFKVLQSSFGDGYTQRTSVGINNRSSTWAYKKTGKKALILEIKAFFDAHKGSDSFLWDSPLDGEVRVHCRIGSLENFIIKDLNGFNVHCRIGSLEMLIMS